MSPRIEREAAIDDMADHAQSLRTGQAVSPVAAWLRDARDIQQRLAAYAAKDIDHAYFRWLAEQLLAKLQGAQRALDESMQPHRVRLEDTLWLDLPVDGVATERRAA